MCTVLTKDNMAELKKFFANPMGEVGVDEAGRGCLAGAVVAAAVILPEHFTHALLNDSKKMTAKTRAELAIFIKKEALDWAIGTASAKEIDEINILQASFLAMHRAIDQLKSPFSHLLIDGNRFKPYKNIKHTCLIKGDATHQSIAAASVLAKTHRDEMMEKLHEHYPQYNWKQNKAYPTAWHKQQVLSLGLCPEHRKTFCKFVPNLNIFETL